MDETLFVILQNLQQRRKNRKCATKSMCEHTQGRTARSSVWQSDPALIDGCAVTARLKFAPCTLTFWYLGKMIGYIASDLYWVFIGFWLA